MLIPPTSRPHRESVVLTPRARRPFGDSIADYNPLGHFGLARTVVR